MSGGPQEWYLYKGFRKLLGEVMQKEIEWACMTLTVGDPTPPPLRKPPTKTGHLLDGMGIPSARTVPVPGPLGAEKEQAASVAAAGRCFTALSLVLFSTSKLLKNKFW